MPESNLYLSPEAALATQGPRRRMVQRVHHRLAGKFNEPRSGWRDRASPNSQRRVLGRRSTSLVLRPLVLHQNSTSDAARIPGGRDRIARAVVGPPTSRAREGAPRRSAAAHSSASRCLLLRQRHEGFCSASAPARERGGDDDLGKGSMGESRSVTTTRDTTRTPVSLVSHCVERDLSRMAAARRCPPTAGTARRGRTGRGAAHHARAPTAPEKEMPSASSGDPAMRCGRPPEDRSSSPSSVWE